jgi:Fe-S cluster biogenesis protein NfuA
MFIRCEETPNPQTLKFIPDDRIILPSGTLEFKNQKQASLKSPLALVLFEISGIKSVFLGKDFITITKNEEINWAKIKTEIQATIMDFLSSGKPILFENLPEKNLVDNQKNTSNHVQNNGLDPIKNESDAIISQIKELIEIKVRPAVAMDGGDIIFHSFEDGIVYLVLKGSCSGCPSSTITLKNGIENMLKHYIPEVEAVEQIDEE